LKDSYYNKSLVFGIIVLFIGAGVVPSISGYTEKIISQQSEEFPGDFPPYADYVNGYWKFNEGNGNTAHDSSGRDYDGAVYGATWTTDTPSGSGYALDFDGVNDYIRLDEYAQNNLGFNKTDDLIFSFYFKTTSTNKGVIFSVSQSTYNPGFHVAINADGTIEIKVWRLSCGLLLTSENSYNDGEWYYVEIVYNGLASNPTVTIYVDGDEDISTTYYVCSFHADQFDKAKIGTRSNDSTNYFDGKIDELKIIKFPGGNEQEPPTIEGPTKGSAGVKYDFTFTTEDPEEDEIEIFIEWGDGTDTGWIGPFESGEEVIRSHTWSKDGAYKINASSRDIWHFSAWAHHTIRIGNLPPDPPTITGPTLGESKVEYEYTFKAIDHEGGKIWFFIDWDDGNYEKWIGPYESEEEVKVKHAWNTKGKYEITAKARDEFGEGELSDPYEVVIDNDPPDIPKISGPTSGKMETEYKFDFSVTDQDGDNVWFWIDWGDGDKIEDFGPYKSGETVTVAHIWYERASFPIKAKARDIYGDFGNEYTFVVIIPRSHNIWFNGWLTKFPLLQRLLNFIFD